MTLENGKRTKKVLPDSYIKLFKLWWACLANGVATVLVIYGTYLIVVGHH